MWRGGGEGLWLSDGLGEPTGPSRAGTGRVARRDRTRSLASRAFHRRPEEPRCGADRRSPPARPRSSTARKGGQDEPELTEDERIDAMDFLARVLVQIPDPRRHSVRYYGFYSNAARGKRKKAAATAESSSPLEAPERAATPQGVDRAALRRGRAEMIRRVYEVDPLCLSSLPRRNARGRLHHPTRRDYANPRSSPRAREGLSPASPCPATCGQPRLRSAPS
jgi:hypothetical protein